jgi:hypothetical protein
VFAKAHREIAVSIHTLAPEAARVARVGVFGEAHRKIAVSIDALAPEAIDPPNVGVT